MGKHVETFHRLVEKFSSYKKPTSEEEKASKLIRTLPDRFAPIAMVAETSNLSFHRIVASVQAEISRRKAVSYTHLTLPTILLV